MDRTITFAEGTIPSWSTVHDKLAQQGIDAPLRMIDGMPAFPDEEPPDDWRELRIALPTGMVTVRREDHTLQFVIWGNADEELQRQWDMLIEEWKRVES